MALPSSRWADLSTRQFAQLDWSRIVALLPVAAIEQHGPHLPVSVDAAINAGILDAALRSKPDDLELLVLPALPVGCSSEHLAFPGTLSLPAFLLAQVWFEMAQSVHRAGCRRIVLFNAHGGQTGLLDIVCRDIRVRLGMLAVACSWFRITDLDGVIGDHEARHGIHGGEIETGIMLHLHRSLVQMPLAENFVPLTVEIERSGAMLTAEGAVGFGWQTQDLHPAGVAGNAAAASSESGKVLVERAAAALIRLLGEVACFPLQRLTSRTRFTPHEPGDDA